MDKSLKNKIFLITYTIAIFFLFKNIFIFWGGLCKVFTLLMPFIYGFAIAYIVNWPAHFFENNIYNKYFKNEKTVKFLSIFSAYLIVFGICGFISIIIVPQIIVSINQLIANSGSYMSSFKNFLQEVVLILHIKNFALIDNLTEKAIKLLSNETFIIKVFDFMKNFAMVTYNWVIGIIISFYFMFNKTDLLLKLRRLFKVCASPRAYKNSVDVLSMSHNVFGKFIIGKIIDSFIIGVLCFIGTTILTIPYSLLISVVVGVTNIIPFFGPFLGAIPCIIILLVIDPIKALWFAIFILILQQIDGNIIGPKILGSSVGISAIFIMFSVILGGGMFGIPGMILGVPVFVVLYNLIATFINKREKGV